MSKLIFSSEAMSGGLAPGLRARAWAESLMAGGYNGEAVVPDGDSPFTGRVELMAPAGTMLARSKASSLILNRRPAHVASDLDDRVTLFFNQGRAAMRTVQMGREMVLRAGEGVLVAQDAPQVLDGSRSGNVIALILPRAPFDDWSVDLHDVAALRHDLTTPAYRLLRGYGRMLVEEAPAMSEEEVQATVRQITELTRLWLRVTAGEAPGDPAARGARFLAIKRLIRRNLGNHGLSPATVAQTLGLSERMVHHVMTASGTSFGQTLNRMRLKLAHGRLSDPAYLPWPIQQIALGCGFADYPSFFRAFRRRYGEGPQALRSRITAARH